VQQHLTQQEIQRTGLSSSTNIDTLKIANVMQQISEDVSEKDKTMFITKLVLNLMKQNGCYTS
jgi:hypothetical protein